MRNHCLLTTLAAGALLAAMAGTALAQSPRVGFTPRSGSVNEGATAATDAEHPLLQVTVRAWNLPAGPAGDGADGQPTARQQAIDKLGEITIETDGIGRREAATISPVYDTACGAGRGRGICRERHLPVDHHARAGWRLAQRRVLPAAAVDRVHRYGRALPGDGDRQRPAGDGDVQPNGHQARGGEQDAPERPCCRPGGPQLSHAGGQPECCLDSHSFRCGRRCRMPDGERIPLCLAHLVGDGDARAWSRAE